MRFNPVSIIPVTYLEEEKKNEEEMIALKLASSFKKTFPSLSVCYLNLPTHRSEKVFS